jgi:uncharacterized RDD family membrane protein YckC
MGCKNHPGVEDNLVRCARCAEAFCPDCIVEIGGQPLCAACKDERLLDLRSGTTASLELASIGSRFAALFLDGLILGIPMVVVLFGIVFPMGLFVPDQFNWGSQLFAMAVGFGAGVVYEGAQLAARGQTVGKRALGLKVLTPEGADLKPAQAWTRALVRQAFGLLSCFGLIDYLTAFGQERTCIHDMAAKTRVVRWNA